MKDNKKNRGIQLAIIMSVIIIVAIVVLDIVSNNVDLKSMFSKTVNYTTSKEVTVTDEGIADAVDKIYDATVIVEIGESKNKITGWGSGFVYKTDDKYAYILTNHHVAATANYLLIVYSNGTSTKGELVGSDEFNDVAVVKVDKDTILAVAEIGKSSDLRVGDTVFAVGTPISLNYSFTVTRGILSGKNRLVEMTSSANKQQESEESYNPFSFYFGQNRETQTPKATDTWYMSLLQIDASINSGNSGGPLANVNGQVVGINNSKLSSSYSQASIENIGFSIPIEDALSVADEIENGTIEDGKKPVLGISMTTIEMAEQSNIKIPESVKYGAVIASVSEGSNADNAGLKAGDVIIEFNGNKIEEYRHLKYYLFKCKIGDKVKVKYLRDGKEKTTEINLKKGE